MSEDIGYAIQKELLEKPGNMYVVDILTRLGEENPKVANFISSFAMTTRDQLGTAYMGVLVYRLLESQAAADKMKREFPI